VLKGAGRFLAPQAGLRVIQRINDKRAWYFRVGGAIALLMSAFLWWVRFWR
jgi:hypothetical protein